MTAYYLKSDVTWSRTISDLTHTMDLWGVADNGWDVKPWREPLRKGPQEVVVHFCHPTRGEIHVRMDHFDWPAKTNLRALYLTLEDMRMIERRGGLDVLIDVSRQLAAPSPFRVLGLTERATAAEVTDAYRRLALDHHPDHGGDASTMAEINAAFAAAKERLEREGRGKA